MYFGDKIGIDVFFGLEVWCEADKAPFEVQADPVEHSLVGVDGVEVEVKITDGVALT